MKYLYSALLIICFLSLDIYSSDNAGAFLEKGIHARASAMGLSQVSIAENSDAIYWNPAFIPLAKKTEIQVMGTKAFETRYTSIQSLFYLFGHPFGVSFTNAYVEGIQETKMGSNQGRYTFSGNTLDYNADAIYFSTGIKILQNFSAGTSVKIVQEKAAGFRANGIGADIGAAFFPSEEISLGMNIQNLIKPVLQWDTPSKSVDTIPTNFKIGGSINFFNKSLITSLDFNFRNNRKTEVNFGVEYWLNRYFPLRAGLDHNELSLGIGLNLYPFVCDN